MIPRDPLTEVAASGDGFDCNIDIYRFAQMKIESPEV